MQGGVTPDRYALVSCYDKSGLEGIVSNLLTNEYGIIASGGTYRYVIELFPHLMDTWILSVENITGFPEILSGRVKTLHPKIHASLLADRSNDEHLDQLREHKIENIEVVVCNLYPFWDVDYKHCAGESSDDDGEDSIEYTKEADAIELIDIGGVALIRAAAKNYQHVTVLTRTSQYGMMVYPPPKDFRRACAMEAFTLTSQYDHAIARYFGAGSVRDRHLDPNVLVRKYHYAGDLKYGCNPHQAPAMIHTIDDAELPFTLVNGSWGYINVLDAVGCWGLVRELSKLTGRAAACSFKHTSPAGAAVAVDWDTLQIPQQQLLGDLYGMSENTPELLNAYIRARNADPQSSFGDFIGLSHPVDMITAKFIAGQISDGVIAPGYTKEALKILSKKKKGKYIVIIADEDYQPEETEVREVFGFAISQPRNACIVGPQDMGEKATVTATPVPDRARLDLMVANCALKYAQSNNVCCAMAGQVVGLSAGQQSRIHSVQLATRKATTWVQRHHPAALALLHQFGDGTKRQEKINVSTSFVERPGTFLEEYGDMFESQATLRVLVDHFTRSQMPFPELCLASDAFFPFPDSILFP